MREPIWLELRDAIAIHEMSLQQHGGRIGIRDEGLLESALARPRQKFAYDPDTTVFALASAYSFGIVRNHPFLDGNKRTGFVAGILFLELNGYRFLASEESAATAVMELAAGAMDEARYAEFLALNAAPPSRTR
jgi:death-on-curing protein